MKDTAPGWRMGQIWPDWVGVGRDKVQGLKVQNGQLAWNEYVKEKTGRQGEKLHWDLVIGARVEGSGALQ